VSIARHEYTPTGGKTVVTAVTLMGGDALPDTGPNRRSNLW
jgi:hypothetical protein